MNTKAVDKWLKETYGDVGGEAGYWELKLENSQVYIISDSKHDRIRIIAPICKTWQVDSEELLKANFHQTLDVRYAVLQDVLYATFLHQLSLLGETELCSALDQVIILCRNTLYRDYMAGELVFAGAYEAEKAEKMEKMVLNLKQKLDISRALGRKIESKEDLIQLWEKCKTEKDLNKKGKFFEEFCHTLVTSQNGFEEPRKRLRTANEEIDIWVKNNIRDPFWCHFESPYIMFECKNQKAKVEPGDLRTFESKICNHSSRCRVGFIIAVNGFTSGCYVELIRMENRGYVMALVGGKDIKGFLESDDEFKFFLGEMITKSTK